MSSRIDNILKAADVLVSVIGRDLRGAPESVDRARFRLEQLLDAEAEERKRRAGTRGAIEDTTAEKIAAWLDAHDGAGPGRLYAGPHPVVAHPPCERWGRYWSGGPSAKVRRTLGDDGGCFESALKSLMQWGGVLEHPEASHAFRTFGISRPPKSGGWIFDGYVGSRGSWVCCVEQGHYGHPARKATWLYFVGDNRPFDLTWGPSQGQRLDEGFHSREERAAARAAGTQPRKRLSKAQNLATPTAFRNVLLWLARRSRDELRAA